MADCDYNFQHEYTLRGSMLNISFNFEGDNEIEGLVQSFQLQLQRQVTTVYDLTSDQIYIVEGNPQGQFGSNSIIAGFCGEPFVCDCDPGRIELESEAGECEGACEGTWELQNVYQQAFNLQTDVQSKVFQASAQYQFTHIETR